MAARRMPDVEPASNGIGDASGRNVAGMNPEIEKEMRAAFEKLLEKFSKWGRNDLATPGPIEKFSLVLDADFASGRAFRCVQTVDVVADVMRS